MRLSPEQFKAVESKPGYSQAAAVTPAPVASAPVVKKRAKYGNTRVFEDGQWFDSKLEVKRYRELQLLRLEGSVSWFTRQVPFILEGGVVFRADFVVAWSAGGATAEDCKGKDTQASINKRKQVKARYGLEVLVWRA